MDDGTAEQEARILGYNCEQWRITWLSTRAEMARHRITYFRITSQKRYQSQHRLQLQFWIQNTRN